MLQVLQFQVHNKHWQFDGSFFEMGGFLWRNASHGWETITRWGVAVLFPDWWPQIPLPAPGPSRSWGSPESTWPACADASTDPQIPSLARPLGNISHSLPVHFSTDPQTQTPEKEDGGAKPNLSTQLSGGKRRKGMKSVPHGVINQSYKARNIRIIRWVGSGTKRNVSVPESWYLTSVSVRGYAHGLKLFKSCSLWHRWWG